MNHAGYANEKSSPASRASPWRSAAAMISATAACREVGASAVSSPSTAWAIHSFG